MLSQIQTLAENLAPRLIEIRRHLHSHPELSGQEYQTSVYVAGVLSTCGIQVREGVGKTGVVGDLVGQDTDPRCLAIRTDMDALPIQERTTLEFASRNPGIMHACGHDVHTTVGLGTAMILAELRSQIPGSIRFCSNPLKKLPKVRAG